MKRDDPFYSLIDEEGIVEDCDVETYFRRCTSIEHDAEMGAIRVFMDDGGTDIETRIRVDDLRKLLAATPPADDGEPATIWFAEQQLAPTNCSGALHAKDGKLFYRTGTDDIALPTKESCRRLATLLKGAE